ncbi:uncharacterized protein LOC126747083 [Anthonomus grandis grandis]|uniref:uncharacterized protein LOC126747083 n=1 Tax=Anthonomus grandis grandis TaxID=2921223 RepID=UPI002166AE67|nr:uncharacterized protein LOC126747083 [Anthonomus grandis grandis]
MSVTKFNYDIVTLIELVEARPCLWNKFSDAYKDKILKKRMHKYLEGNFNNLNEQEQQKIGKCMFFPVFIHILEIRKKLNEPSNEDESFFNSVVPMITTMSEEEKIEFRMGVLQLIKKIKQKRQISTSSITFSTSPVSDFSAVSSPSYTILQAANPSTTNYQSFYQEGSYTSTSSTSQDVSQHFQNSV